MVKARLHEELKFCSTLLSKKNKCGRLPIGISTDARSKHPRTSVPCFLPAQYVIALQNSLTKKILSRQNKLDIWALGCILYEFISDKKAFTGDWSVTIYRISEWPLPIPLPDDTPKVLRSYISGIVRNLLNRNRERRPGSLTTSIHSLSCSLLLDPSHVQTIGDVQTSPLHREWRVLVQDYPNEKGMMLQIGDHYLRNGYNSTAISRETAEFKSLVVFLSQSILARKQP